MGKLIILLYLSIQLNTKTDTIPTNNKKSFLTTEQIEKMRLASRDAMQSAEKKTVKDYKKATESFKFCKKISQSIGNKKNNYNTK